MTDKLYPLLLNPSLHVKVWGGRKLASELNKGLPSHEPYGEAWELHDSSVIANGALEGQTLGQVLAHYGTDLIGEGNNPAEGFPLLAKFLDANDWLSVQVHPNDAQAAQLEGEPRGKTEAWIVLQAEPNAQLVLGVQPNTTREMLAQAIREGNLEQHINYVDVQSGDVLLLNANTVHALGPGILIYEIQQSSDTTYRLYDWNRLDLNGTARELHIEKGVQVSNVDYTPTIEHLPLNDAPVITLVECAYFKTNRHHLFSHGVVETHINTYGKFHALTCINGQVWVQYNGTEPLTFSKGQTVLIPACLGAYTLGGDGDVLRSWQPN